MDIISAPRPPQIDTMMDFEHECEFLYQFNRSIHCPKWNKSWWEFTKDGDWIAALYPIGNGIKQAIEKACLRPLDRLKPLASRAERSVPAPGVDADHVDALAETRLERTRVGCPMPLQRRPQSAFEARARGS